MTNKWQILSATIKEKDCQKFKKTAPLSSYFEGQMHLYTSVYL